MPKIKKKSIALLNPNLPKEGSHMRKANTHVDLMTGVYEEVHQHYQRHVTA